MLPALTTKDLVRRAIEMDIPDIGRLRVIHPVDVLDSRIQNLHLLPEKRNEAGIAQARLALGVARAFIAREVATRGERVGLKLLERIAEMATDIAAVRVYLLYGIDPLEAVPLEHFRTTTALHKVRWPQILAEVTRKLESRDAKTTANAVTEDACHEYPCARTDRDQDRFPGARERRVELTSSFVSTTGDRDSAGAGCRTGRPDRRGAIGHRRAHAGGRASAPTTEQR